MSRKKFISESLYDNKEYVEDMLAMIKKCASLHQGEEYAEFGVLLGYLRGLGMVHQSHHWQTMGEAYYGDHLLFERLYNDIPPEVDLLAEKIVGIGGIKLTNYFSQLHHMEAFMNGASKGEALHIESYRAELMFVIAGEIVMDIMETKNILTRGIEQALGNVLDKHEEHLYLLQQRSNN